MTWTQRVCEGEMLEQTTTEKCESQGEREEGNGKRLWAKNLRWEEIQRRRNLQNLFDIYTAWSVSFVRSRGVGSTSRKACEFVAKRKKDLQGMERLTRKAPSISSVCFLTQPLCWEEGWESNLHHYHWKRLACRGHLGPWRKDMGQMWHRGGLWSVPHISAGPPPTSRLPCGWPCSDCSGRSCFCSSLILGTASRYISACANIGAFPGFYIRSP